MRTPTVEQQAVIDNKDAARIRVVRAAPGSGKTWMVAELILRELNSWQTHTSGLAALSFTRVGGEEIRKALGRDLSHPHFVGTIDSFLFRYVIRPFYCKCYPSYHFPRLLPGEWGAEHWSNLGRGLKAEIGKGINLCSCFWVDEDENGPIAARKPHPAQPFRKLEGEDLKLVRQGKKNVWKNSGLMTHSDAAMLASKILEHEKHRAIILAEITRRFPLIFVDELQDTGYFLSKCLHSILRGSGLRGVLVGDPDQAIFEFSGARPDLFDQFEKAPGAEVFPLGTSLRCSISVAKAAGHLKDSGAIASPPTNPLGRAILVGYEDMVVDFNRLSAAISPLHSGRIVKAIARLNATVMALKGRKSEVPHKLGSPSINHFQRSIIAFRQGQNSLALASCRAAIELALFEREGISEEELSEIGHSDFDWRERCIKCLLEGDLLDVNTTLFEWHTKAGAILAKHISSVALSAGMAIPSAALKPKKRKPACDTIASMTIPIKASIKPLHAIPIETVHAVKGETHAITIFVCPESTKAASCPSQIWWSTDFKDREVRRIAYVAMTRSCSDLILFVPKASQIAFKTNRSIFAGDFQFMTTDEAIELYSNPNFVQNHH